MIFLSVALKRKGYEIGCGTGYGARIGTDSVIINIERNLDPDLSFTKRIQSKDNMVPD